MFGLNSSALKTSEEDDADNLKPVAARNNRSVTEYEKPLATYSPRAGC
ncbi:hypothetical protein Metme_1097 [Methylomonas methanica MC09]|uniref:Uncharacterized protein n=2 Tax=Methylomonas methanica TaxID=421 RepID=F9ZVQ3_METMM|nr:hypothetical protein Metme_1097 [Methylomonas methanica MC09]